MRSEFIQVLQREQDEALLLLESNPFLSSLFMKYVTASSFPGFTGYLAEEKTAVDFHDKYESLLKKSNEAAHDAERIQKELRAELAQANAACAEEKVAHAEPKALLRELINANEKACSESTELQKRLEVSRIDTEQAEVS